MKTSKIIIATLAIAIFSSTSMNLHLVLKNRSANKRITLLTENDSLKGLIISNFEESFKKVDELLNETQLSLIKEKGKVLKLNALLIEKEKSSIRQVEHMNVLFNSVINRLDGLSLSYQDLLVRHSEQKEYYKAELNNKEKIISLKDWKIKDLLSENQNLMIKFPENKLFADAILRKTLKRRVYKTYKNKGLVFDNDAMNGFIFILNKRDLKKSIEPFVVENEKNKLSDLGFASSLLQRTN